MLSALTALAAVAGGCNATATSCQRDVDCGDAQVCDLNNACVAVSCNTDAECGGRACTDGACVAKPADLDSACPLPSTTPSPDAVDVDMLADIHVVLTDGGAAPTVHIGAVHIGAAGPGGGELPFTTVVDDNELVVVPTAPLLAATAYKVTLDLACGARSFTFTTEDSDAVDTAHFTPRVIAWDLSNVQTVPASASGLLGLIGVGSVLLSLDAHGGTLGFVGEDGQQRPCDPTLALVGAGDNPRYAYTATVPQVSLQNGGLRDVVVRGVARASGVDQTDLAGLITLDARRIAYHVDATCVPGADGFPACAQAVCAYSGTLGLACGPCDDGESFCAIAEIKAPSAATSLTIAPRSLADVCAQQACADDPVCQ